MLSRLALRLAAIEVLAPAAIGPDGPWPTIAGPRVFDSRQDPVDVLDDIDGKPIVIVYTEQSESAAYKGGTHFLESADHYVELTVEIMIAAKGIVAFEGPTGEIVEQGTLDQPIMERDHEALLDLLEAAVRRRLVTLTDIGDPTVLLFHKAAHEIRHVNTVPLRDATRTVRLAARTCVFKVKIPSDEWAKPVPGYVAPLDPIDSLPEPLRSVAKALPDGSSGKIVCARIAALVRDPAAVTRLDRLTVSVPVDRGFTPPLAADVTGEVDP